MSNDLTGLQRRAWRACSALTLSPLWYLVFLSGVGTILLMAAAGCGKKSSAAQVSGGFVGNAACAPCHAQEFAQHRASHHFVTMRPVDQASMGPFWPRPGELPGTDFAIYETTAGYAMGWKSHASDAEPMQFALGSDRFAFTYIRLMNNNSLIELPESYYPPAHAWLLTPGQSPVEGAPVGRYYNEDLARHCLGCHTTTLPEKGVTPEPRFYGVGCESCHGPGQKHIEAVQAGKTTDLAMEKLGAQGATKLNRVCGRCHRNPEDVPADDADMTQRFEPYGLMKSRCFLESGDMLSCVTCHNPHQDASTDKKGYEKVCLGCHRPASSFGPPDPQHKPCPVQPRSGCIPCHMPRRKPIAGAPFDMADHDIRVFTEEGTRSP